MEALGLAIAIGLVAIAAWFVVEYWAIKTGRRTISEGNQRLFDMMSKQLIAGIFFLLGTLAGWFIAHFTSPPPVM